jgi:ketosteroid isomerase-like protein
MFVFERREEIMATPRETVHAAIAAFNAHDLPKVAGFFRPDVVLVTSDTGEVKGRGQASECERTFMEAFPDVKMEIAASYESGDTAIVEWVFNGTHTGPLPLPSGGGTAAGNLSCRKHFTPLLSHADGGR